MSGRIIAIGDIHGCARALESLIQALALQADDLLIPLGDYVDRGRDSRRVLELLLDWASRVRLVPLLGNHEVMMLGVLDGRFPSAAWAACGGRQTLDSYGGSLDHVPAEHIAFLRGCRRYYESDACAFVHANYDADLDWDQQRDDLILWQHIEYRLPPPHKSGKPVVVGHTPQTSGEILDLGHLICIDTCCHAGGWLTALDVTTRQVWQTNLAGELRDLAEAPDGVGGCS